jgi:hypothetical protein
MRAQLDMPLECLAQNMGVSNKADVCMYKGGGAIGPCTATYSGLLCFPFYSSPQQSYTSNETQDLVRRLMIEP